MGIEARTDIRPLHLVDSAGKRHVAAQHVKQAGQRASSGQITWIDGLSEVFLNGQQLHMSPRDPDMYLSRTGEVYWPVG